MLSRPFSLDDWIAVANKYLEKIASKADSLADAAVAGVKAIGRVAHKGVKAYGNQIHLSLGGAYREHAHDVLGVRNTYQLAEFGSGEKSINKLYEASKKKFGDTAEHHKEWTDKTLPHLKHKQTDARITLGATTAAGVYGAKKLKEDLQGPQTQTYYNY